jgi:hypothetical protein
MAFLLRNLRLEFIHFLFHKPAPLIEKENSQYE